MGLLGNLIDDVFELPTKVVKKTLEIPGGVVEGISEGAKETKEKTEKALDDLFDWF